MAQRMEAYQGVASVFGARACQHQFVAAEKGVGKVSMALVVTLL